MAEILNHELTDKYLCKEWKDKIRTESLMILDEIKYLKMHSTRTSRTKGGWLIIPKPSLFHGAYGDGKIFWHLRSILSANEYWESPAPFHANFTLESIMSALVTNSEIIRSIFKHEDKDEINEEHIPDFIKWFKILKENYEPWIARDILDMIDYSYSHSSRYCLKSSKFKEEITLRFINNQPRDKDE